MPGHGYFGTLPPMPSSPQCDVTLTCHPTTPSTAVRRIDMRLARMPGGTLAVTYSLEGDISHVRVPPPQAPRFADWLWHHTCCELFVSHKSDSGYHEYNLSPSSEWAAYAFARFREQVPLTVEREVESLNPQIALRRTATKLTLDAWLPLGRFSPRYVAGPLSLALSVIVEDQNGVLSYWAFRHAPGDKPEFHHPDGFALELA
jgi:hypothetical protein